MPIIFTILFVALALFVIYTNIESLVFRIVWVLVVAACFIPGSSFLRIAGPFGVMVILAVYQSYKNKQLEEDD